MKRIIKFLQLTDYNYNYKLYINVSKKIEVYSCKKINICILFTEINICILQFYN